MELGWWERSSCGRGFSKTKDKTNRGRRGRRIALIVNEWNADDESEEVLG
jgi:hypothetical protein